MTEIFQPPPFRSHLFLRGGHLQTIASIRNGQPFDLPTQRHTVPLGDGDSIVLHDDPPISWQPGDASILLIHGLCGCHAASYMLRLAKLFFDRGVRVFRVDMRGSGAGAKLANQLTHAGRSDDVLTALGAIAEKTQAGKIRAIGVSLGGNQLLRAAGRVGAGLDPTPSWIDRVDRIAVVAPPLDLHRCSDNMERWILRPYNYYFISVLLSRIPAQVTQREDFQRILTGPRPKTLRQLDERITAPLSGFRDAEDYYQQSSAMHVAHANQIQTLVLAANDDPVVPIQCFTDDTVVWPESTQLLVSSGGGHVGFIGRKRKSWMDEVLGQWFQQ